MVTPSRTFRAGCRHLPDSQACKRLALVGFEHVTRELIQLDPESEESLELMRTIIAEEINVRISMNDDKHDAETVARWADLAADALLNAFQVRRRPPDSPRYSRNG
jgi:hypothetical protein